MAIRKPSDQDPRCFSTLLENTWLQLKCCRLIGPKLGRSVVHKISAQQGFILLGLLEQSVTCLPTDASLTADPGVTCSIPARSHTFVEIYMSGFIFLQVASNKCHFFPLIFTFVAQRLLS